MTKWPEPFNENNDHVNIIIESPFKSRNKFSFDPQLGLFKLTKVLPAGLAFPCDMGFIPHTIGEDGDPLDALILMDEITYPGCLVECRLTGLIEALQTDKGKTFRNNRFIFVPSKMKDFDHIRTIEDINKHKLDAIIKFFEVYNDFDGKRFELARILGPEDARSLIQKHKTNN